MPGSCSFNDAWLQKPVFKEWLQRVEGQPHKACCKACSKTFDVSNMGEAAVTSHMEGKKHKQALQIRKSSTLLSAWAAPKNAKDVNHATTGNADGTGASSNPEPTTSVENRSSGLIPSGKNRTMDSFVTKSDTLSSEITWCLHVVTSHSSFRSSDGTGGLFQRMFPDSVIAKEFTCGKDKCARLAVFGIAPHFKSLLERDVNLAKAFVLLFDESLNFENQKKQMDVHVRFWQHDQVSTRYFGSEYLGKGDAEHLVQSFLASAQSLHLGKLVQIGMDGPNVNLKFHRLMSSHMNENYDKQLLDIGSCGLHQIHGALKNAMDKNTLFERLQRVFKSLFYLFDDAPARKTEYTAVTGASKFGLQFCKHRWVENLPVAKRALEIWPNVVKYVGAVEKKDKRVTKPTCKSFTDIKEATKDSMTVPLLQVYISICKELQPILVKYQTDKPMIPFLGADIFTMLRNLTQRFANPEDVKELTTQSKLLKFDAKKSKCEVKKVRRQFKKIHTYKTLNKQSLSK